MVKDHYSSGSAIAIPLYRARGVDKERLELGIDWLVRDFVQLLRHRGVRYDSSREILHNVRALFECSVCTDLAT